MGPAGDCRLALFIGRRSRAESLNSSRDRILVLLFAASREEKAMQRNVCVRAALGLAWFLLLCPSLRGQIKDKGVPKKTAIRAGRLIDGKSESPVNNVLIVIEGDQIVSDHNKNVVHRRYAFAVNQASSANRGF